MSELKARKYTSIRMLRDEIRQDMEDYKLSWYTEPSSDIEEGYYLIFSDDYDRWFGEYLREQITCKVKKLKQLTYQENK